MIQYGGEKIRSENMLIVNKYWMWFCDIQTNQGQGRSYQLKPKAEAENFYRDLDYSRYYKNQI